jgi:hypothetical protein
MSPTGECTSDDVGTDRGPSGVIDWPLVAL